MFMPTIEGVVERRLLVNYRADPEWTSRLLPAPLRPQLVRGYAVVGICLIRLGDLRPKGLPAAVGLRSENAAHRIAVEWDADGERRTGVYIPRRDTNAVTNVLLGGRVFPGVHHRATFEVDESEDTERVAFAAHDGTASVDVTVASSARLDASALFEDLDDASNFFRQGAAGYSTTRDAGRLDGLELRTSAWRVEPLAVRSARSSFFDDAALFPPGAAELDCALRMRDTPVTWHAIPSLAVVARSG